MFNGYVQYGGTEIVNAARTKAYVDHELPAYPLDNCVDCGGLQEALGDSEYASPLQDDAPWYDESNPATAQFYGLYPLSLEGFEDDTRTASVQENIGDGGFVGGVRRGTRSLRIHGVLIGANEDAVSSGLAWLKAAVSNTGCAGGDCNGASLCWYSACPDITECYDESAGSAGNSEQTGPVSPATPASFFGPSIDGKYSVAWLIPQTDGVVFRYGMTTKDGVPLNTYGPYVSARTNRLVNPSFDVDTSTWTAEVGTITRQATGGVDGGGNALVAVSGSGAPTVTNNWVPESSAEEGTPSTWTTNGQGGFRWQEDFTAPFGEHVIQVVQDPAQTALTITVPILGPASATAGQVSLYMKATTDTYILSVLNASNAVVATKTIAGGSLPAGYSRVTLASNIAAGYKIRLTTNTVPAIQPLNVDAFMATPGALVNYFDGDSDDSPSTKTFYSWINGDPTQGSQRYVYAVSNARFVSARPLNTTFGPAMISIAVRSDTGANVTIEGFSDSTDASYGTTTFATTPDWQRVYLEIPDGRAFYFKVSGDSNFYVDQINAEHSEAQLPYIDKNVHNLPFPSSKASDYEFSVTPEGWGRMEWIGQTWNTTPNTIVFPDVCGNDWVANLTTDYGTFDSSTLAWSVIGRVTGPMQSERWERTFHEVTVTSGPSVLQDYSLTVGAAKEVEIILTAGSPFTYAATKDLIRYEPVTDFDMVSWYDYGWLDSRNLMIDPSVLTASHFATSVSSGAATAAITSVTGNGLPSYFQGSCIQSLVTTVVPEGGSLTLRTAADKTITPVTAGQAYSGGVYAKGVGTVPASYGTVSTVLQWLNASNGVISTVTLAGPTLTIDWQLYKIENQVAPAGAVGATIGVQVLAAASGTLPVNFALKLAAFQFNAGATLQPAASGAYSDPSGTYLFQWEGTANASTSRRYSSFLCAADLNPGPISDPNCPTPPTKPTLPTIDNSCIETPQDWLRYYLEIDAQEVSAWNQTVPTIAITSKGTEVRSIRVRFYPNPFGYDAEDVDPCSYCSEFILSYIPPSTELTIDGTVQRATASVAGLPTQPASNLLYGTDGTPMTWPSLSCGVPYVMTIDTPTNAPNDLSVSLSLTRQE